MNEPQARHYGSGRHRLGADGIPGPWPLAWRLGRIRPQFLTAAAVALALVSATSVYATVQAGVPADSVAGSPAAAATAQLPAPALADPPGGQTGQTADLPGTPAATPPAEVPAGVPAEAVAPPPAPAAVVAPALVTPAIGPKLDAQINAVIEANSRYRLGVALIDVSDGVVHEYGARSKFVAASTAKILAAAAYYNLAETGRAALTDPLGASTAAVQIKQMVQQSNNESWALIMAAVGQKRLSDYAASIGIDYDRTVNILTPAEMARMLALLYTGQLLNPVNTGQLLSYMQNTNYETLIPAALPPGVGVFHKYGLLNGNLHDASVVVQGDRAFVFVVYTLGRDLTDLPARARIIQELTRTVAAGLF